MAVYRADQAQVTFQSEAAPGGYVERASAVTDDSGKVAKINDGNDVPAGSRTITVDNLAGIVAGMLIQIGPEVNESGTSAESEVRRVVHVDGTTVLVLDAPTAFYHANNTNIQVVTAVTDTDADKYITLIPGVYETVDVPDPEVGIEGMYFLGTNSKRDFFTAYSGQQVYTGSIGGFTLLNGRALRYPIGRVYSTTTYRNTTSTSTTMPDWGCKLNGAAKKGDIFVIVNNAKLNNSATNITTNAYLLFTGSTSEATFTSTTSEIRKYVGAGSQVMLQLDYPLQFDHATTEYVYTIQQGTGTNSSLATSSTVVPYVHNIRETVDLDSVSWNVHMRDSSETDANDFDRRFFGGKIGSMTLTAEEGGMVTASWEGVNFLGMIHNQRDSSAVTTPDGTTAELANVPFYSLMQPIRSGNVDFPTTEPYYFSGGEVQMFGQTIARIRSFSLSVNNNIEPRYYITKQLGRRRGPTELREQRREYSLAVTLALPDVVAANTAQRSLFSELVLEGNYGGTNFNRTGKQGFDVVITLTRGEVISGTDDKITITIPDDGTAATGGNQQGAFIRTAPHNISTDNPFQVEADILFRNMKIEIQDAEHYYP